MKSFKIKFLLLSIAASLSFGSCNTYPGFFNWMFGLGSKKVAEPTFINDLKSLGSESFELLKTPLMIAMIAIQAYYLINFIFKNRANATVNPDGQKVDKIWKSLSSLPNLEVEGSVERERNFAQNREDNVVKLARSNNILMGGEIGFKVVLENGQSAINTVRQLYVNGQRDSSCGPRALYNVNVVSQVFDNNNGVFVNDINLLADLNTLPGLDKNPKLRQFFIEMKNIGPNPGVESDEGLQNLQGAQLEAFLEHCKPENNKSVKIKNTDIMDGYTECFDSQIGSRIGDFMGYENLVGILNTREIGYSHGYVICNGQNEGRSIGHKSGGHWISLFVIKTGVNEYSWYVLDSMNGNYVNSDIIKAYIYKLLGSVYQDYETNVINPAKERNAKAEDEKSFNEIKKRFDILKLLNTNLDENDNQIHISSEFETCVNRLNTSETTRKFKDNFLIFVEREISEIGLLGRIDQQKKTDLVDKMRKFVASEHVSKIKGSAEDAFVTHPEDEVEEKKELNKSMKDSMFAMFDLAVDISELNKKDKDKKVFDKTKASVKTFLDKNKEAKTISDLKVPGELASEIREELKIPKDKKLNVSLISKWINAKSKSVNGDLEAISKKEKDDLVKNLEEFKRILNIK